MIPTRTHTVPVTAATPEVLTKLLRDVMTTLQATAMGLEAVTDDELRASLQTLVGNAGEQTDAVGFLLSQYVDPTSPEAGYFNPLVDAASDNTTF